MPRTPRKPRGGGTASTRTEKNAIPIVGPPWTLTGECYTLSFWIPGSRAADLPSMAYSPLEGASSFSGVASGRPVGGFGVIQIMRFRESTVGPYDQLVILPGKFEWSRETADGQHATGQSYKVMRAYVSQKDVCHNSRTNWNMPKHLAKFEWEDHADHSVTVKVYPHDTTDDEKETEPSTVPFFQATIKAVPYLPAFPFSSNWLSYTGMSSTAVFPPLPEGKGSQGELPGTNCWRKVSPTISGPDAALATFDMAQSNEEGNANFWPGLGRWHMGVKIANATMTIGPPDENW